MKKLTALLVILALSLVLVTPVWAAAPEHANNKTAILLVAFGTSYESGRKAFTNLEEQYKKAFPQAEIRWAYTADKIRHILASRDKIFVDDLPMALAKLHDQGYQKVIVQPTHIFPGEEYHDLKSVVAGFKQMEVKGQPFFQNLVLANPVLYHSNDYQIVVDRVIKKLVPADKKTALVLMGHGSEHFANSSYGALNDLLRHQTSNVFLGTVEGYPSLNEVRADLKAKKTIKNLVLMPFMLVAGDHANNDLAGDEPDSWKSILQKDGYQVKCLLKGLGETPELAQILIQHTKEALNENK